MKKMITLLAMTCASIAGYAEIRTVDSLKPIEEELSVSGKETLVLLDIGHTLMEHNDAVMDPRNDDWKRAWFQKNYPVPRRDSRIATARAVESAIENWHLVDKRWPEVIVNAQAKGMKVVALTKVIVDPSLQGLRNKNLKNLGVFLKDDLNGLPSGQTYLYADGVIETEAPLKGPILKEIFPRLAERPAKIVFVDDRIEQAQSIEAACKEAGIPCIAFHYTAYQKVVREFDEAVAEFQLRTLLDEQRWIPEAEARKALKQKNPS
jgi:hypothetical protein